MADPEKAYLKFEDGVRIPCMFNPERFSITKTNKWREAGGGDTSIQTEPGAPARPKIAPLMEFERAEAATIGGLELWFDTTDTGKPVTGYTDKILGQMEISTKLSGRSRAKGNERPPLVVFGWGQMTSFPCIITKATVSFEFFSSSGTALRAKVTLDLTQARPVDGHKRQNPTSGTPIPHRVHRVQRGETLDRISAQYYGDSTRWRMLAAANGIEDPLGLRPGSLISVPELGA